MRWKLLPFLWVPACWFSCLVKDLGAINTFAGLSQPPPITPYPSFGWGWIRNSNTANSSLSTQWMQFTGHESTDTCKFHFRVVIHKVMGETFLEECYKLHFYSITIISCRCDSANQLSFLFFLFFIAYFAN
jgi:hypothetical protein